VSWERDILPLRVANYNPRWLDDLCLAGDVAWSRLSLRKSNGGSRAGVPSRATPISMALRRDLGTLLEVVRGEQQPEPPTAGSAGAVYDALKQHGALFFDDLAAASRVLPSQLEEGLWDLVGRGLVTGDGFAPLREIMAPGRSSRIRNGHYHHSRVSSPRLARVAGPQGRWSIVHRFQQEPTPADDLAEKAAMQLLSRYGVVFRDLIARENLAVPWRDVIRALRRQEARGVVRGGRFVSGFIGEQYALPEAVDALRRVRKQERAGEVIRLSATDPLNLAGIITPGPRVPALPSNGVIFRDGLPVAVEEGRSIKVREGVSDELLEGIALRQ
jgi:ATP-dependent Lhr-like helicase